jgi:hypothetical protein
MTPDTKPGVMADSIDLNDPQAVQRWAAELDVSAEQIKDAVAVVGARATDVEMHLKGSRSSTNSDRVDELGG